MNTKILTSEQILRLKKKYDIFMVEANNIIYGIDNGALSLRTSVLNEFFTDYCKSSESFYLYLRECLTLTENDVDSFNIDYNSRMVEYEVVKAGSYDPVGFALGTLNLKDSFASLVKPRLEQCFKEMHNAQ